MPTQLIRDLYNILTCHQGGVVTIGHFDGVHLGHQQLIANTINKAKALNAPSILITFEPQAQEFFNPEKAPARLTRFREKFSALARCGIDYVLILKFNQSLASLSANDFLLKIHDALHFQHVIIGEDFRYGKARLGDTHALQEMGNMLKFSVDILSIQKMDNEKVSSTRIRQALAQGDHIMAAHLLGRPYTMMGRVGHGDKLGRQWGYPTANIFLHRQLTPVAGVYTVLLHGITSHALPGVANVGIRPTIDGTRTLLEVHLFDFDQNIYGRYVTVQFCEKLREEVRFANIDLLKEQIAKDVIAAKHYFLETKV